MQTSPLGLPVRGARHPRVNTHPPYVDSYGPEAIELAQIAGLFLDPWQQDSLTLMLAIGEDGKFTCLECAEILGRQNGKSAILEARVLAGMILLGEKLIIWTAHEVKTALELFGRLGQLFEALEKAGVLEPGDIKVSSGNGYHGFLRRSTGQRIKFIARSKGSGRGFSGDVVIVDEAYAYTRAQQDALMPTMSARTVTGNPQIIYASSPPLDGESGEVLYALRERGESGTDPSLLWRDWGLAGDLDNLDKIDLGSPANWAATNPALGIRITVKWIQDTEYRAMSPAGFARERLCIWPVQIKAEGGPISPELWRDLADKDSRRVGDVAFGVAIAKNRRYAAIAVCGRRADGLLHWEIIAHAPGTHWLVKRLVKLRKKHDPVAIAIDARGPAASVIAALNKVGIREPEDPDQPQRGDLAVTSGADMGAAFGLFVDAAVQLAARHRDQLQLSNALAGATVREIGDGAQAWGRKGSAEISCLEAVTLATWALDTRAHLLVEDGPPNLW
ncbi:hypothetical protein [Micromonospora thermarum]|uniref:Terminase n=1 Tax=Micromonospora thermarum TaxID=2720024 RepID=A0ABX0ZCV0_9ACTN|nr:hypothetical protein [Micromonospora thermarum]NJP33695.1 hypothetical protein [Micromonospora thermarum]